MGGVESIRFSVSLKRRVSSSFPASFMKAIGIEKAIKRLLEARKHLATLTELEKGLNVPAFETEWSQFLSALNSVHEIIRTSAKSDATSRQWFGGKLREIKSDPLLVFLLQARGSDYHGLESGAEPHVEGAKYLGYQYPQIAFVLEAEDGTQQVIDGSKTGGIALEGNVDSFSFSFKLAAVSDERYGNVFSPPSTHLGAALSDQKPTDVGRLALVYYERLISDARRFLRSPR